ncbi:hypothetical protein A2773_06800 [Candidatus Gottesmanbacteria bacterium RIFCSPHIGHO2_01_FULL_39_10]|uniref:DUF3800 domain-containing protein n=1 Tax=Candidatus Gottesmanbacteria bacterium RIFCSPHIGHO2_01_FULL_39_10 TaxID=1798375 RepID=A0A1F5ZNR2_9BACT|nr:MAG: hypothetical protein A2773_06800 [Candidatus Gottesmanbacteria bacterium RIFCSPHIGHO2_01_FULL_39_10]
MNKTLYLFIDEAGNFDFSPNGTKYFVLTCMSTFQPVEEREKLISLRYELLADGIGQEFFHATEDKQIVRGKVFEIITTLKDDIEVHTVIAQKNKANPVLYREEYEKKGKKIVRIVGADFYHRVCQTLLQYVFRRSNFKGTDKIVVVLGSIFTRDKQSYILKALKNYLKENFAMPFEIYFHISQADLNCQLADYFGWAVYVRKERNEERPYNLIRSKIKSNFEIFSRGQTTYYDYQ